MNATPAARIASRASVTCAAHRLALDTNASTSTPTQAAPSRIRTGRIAAYSICGASIGACGGGCRASTSLASHWVGQADRLQRCVHRSEEHTSELQSRGLISYAVFCLKKKKQHTHIATGPDAAHTTRALGRPPRR